MVKKKKSTDPSDSSHYVPITKYHKLKDDLISEKCKSADFQKEVINWNKVITNLREINDHMQESLKQFVQQNQDVEVQKHKSKHGATKSMGADKRRSNLNASQLNSHFINKYLNKLRTNVENYDIYHQHKRKSVCVSGGTKTPKMGCSKYSQDKIETSDYDLPIPKSLNYSISKFQAKRLSPLTKFL